MKLEKRDFLQIMITTILAAAIITIPLISNQSDLPLGWDIPKVYAWWIVGIILLALSIMHRITDYSEKSVVKRGTYSDFYLTAILVYLFVTSLFSPYREIALLGNQYREQGILLFILLIAALWQAIPIVYKYMQWLAIAFIISSCIQAISVIYKFILFYFENPALLDDGDWLYGTFGQTNFMAGHVLIGALFSLHFIMHAHNNKLKILSIVSFVLASAGIIASFSIWGIISLFVGILLLISAHLVSAENFRTFFIGSLATAAILFVSLVQVVNQNIETSNLRTEFWRETVDVYSQTSDPQRLLFGTGPDTLYKVFEAEDRFPQFIVDRAHNFFLDVWVSAGFIGLAVLLGVLAYMVWKSPCIAGNPLILTTFIIMWVWLFRSFVHTSSIVNLVDFGILFGLTVHEVFQPRISTDGH